ncbi:hypothetical protein HY995_05610 [Candidatus Micrarchaeota archaeon]|nr:hypothetical protein [Candidatus Micrarchaeota archaeon]MBI5177531.1 hypothetical protein [Candidatus Micrarchaeota archaeon]
MDVSCPQCGNPQLDVDAENSVVYCKNCGFAVKVDPQTGQATPISMGNGPAGGGMQSGPAMGGGGEMAGGPAMGGGYSGGTVFGFDPTTFLLGGVLLSLVAVLAMGLDIVFAVALILLVLYFYYTKR